MSVFRFTRVHRMPACVGVLAFLFAMHLSSWAHAAPTKYALLVGIDDYQATEIPDLRGCVNDVELMKSVLVGKFEFPPEHVTVLKNEQATHQGIVDAIRRQLIDRVQAGDIVVMHYSGHGSRMRDASGDEIDGYDETLVPHDSRTRGVFDISDDEINGLLAQLTVKTKKVTFIFDSCHSGAASRGGNVVRKIPQDDRPPPVAPAYALGSRGLAEGEADFRLNGSDYVLISGCRATELSNEGVFEQRRHGAMTWFLSQALQAADDASTYRSIMDQVGVEVTNRYPSQHPQLEGFGTDLRVFGADRINAKPYLLVESVDGDSVRLGGGRVYGLGIGTRLRIYTPGTVDFAETEAIATVEINQLDDFFARAIVTQGGGVRRGAKALLQAVSFGEVSVPVFVDQKAHQSLKEVAAGLANYAAIQPVQTEADARLIIDRNKDTISIKSGDLELLVAPVSMGDKGYVQRVLDQVKDIVHWLIVMDLQSPGQAIDIGFEMALEDDESATRNVSQVAPGTRLIYRVRNRDDMPLFVYVLDVSSDGSITLLYPKVGGAQEALPAGEALEQTIETFLPQGQTSVTDVLKVIATKRPIDPSVFPQGSLRNAAPPPATRGRADLLAEFLAQRMRGKTRGMKQVEVTSWVTRQHAIKIR